MNLKPQVKGLTPVEKRLMSSINPDPIPDPKLSNNFTDNLIVKL